MSNNAGIASSSGTVPDSIEAMARDAISFLDALGPDGVDPLGHSMGGLAGCPPSPFPGLSRYEGQSASPDSALNTAGTPPVCQNTTGPPNFSSHTACSAFAL